MHTTVKASRRPPNAIVFAFTCMNTDLLPYIHRAGPRSRGSQHMFPVPQEDPPGP